MHKVIFFGSSEYSLIILSALLKLPDFQVTTIVTKPDKPVGRRQLITPNPVAQYARHHHLPLLQPESFYQNLISKIYHLQSDLGLCVAYGPPFFTPEMIDIPKYKIINIHPSPLPKYRGATPGPWQIINGETRSAVTFFQIDPLPDHGPIVSQIPFDIAPDETAGSFYIKAFTLAASKLKTILDSYIASPHLLTPQDHSQKSYYPKFSKESAKINWSWDVEKIYRFINALNPWPIAWTFVTNSSKDILRMKIFSSSIINQNLDFNLVQIEGKRPVLWDEIKSHYQLIK